MLANPHYARPQTMNAVSWEGRLELASDVVEVITVCREFLATFTPQELDTLPKACQPPLKLVDIDDVNAYAFDLVRHDCADPEHREIVQNLAAFFSHAARRVSKLLAYRQREIAKSLRI
jgi:hypothetical protein